MALTPSPNRAVLGTAKMNPDGQIRLMVVARSDDGGVLGDMDAVFPAAVVKAQGWQIEPFPAKPGDEGTVFAST